MKGYIEMLIPIQVRQFDDIAEIFINPAQVSHIGIPEKLAHEDAYDIPIVMTNGGVIHAKGLHSMAATLVDRQHLVKEINRAEK